ncbi:MAG: HAD-IA family hydrolase [Rhodothermales bacterium]|nr:HAD-IA family hydrolase [Rhodothermales bacterium]
MTTEQPAFVFFDLDDTLLDHRAAERAALADCCAHFDGFGHHPVEHVQARYHDLNVPLWRRYAAGEIAKRDVQRLRFERLLDGLAVNGLAPDALGDHYMRRYAAHWDWIDGAEAAFAAVAERFPVGILTNGFREVQHAKLDRFPVLRERAEAIVISEEVGVMKPQPGIFQHAAEEAGVRPERILYVGDSLHSDVEGGLAAGWQVAWYSGDADVAAARGAFAFSDWGTLLATLAPAS